MSHGIIQLMNCFLRFFQGRLMAQVASPSGQGRPPAAPSMTCSSPPRCLTLPSGPPDYPPLSSPFLHLSSFLSPRVLPPPPRSHPSPFSSALAFPLHPHFPSTSSYGLKSFSFPPSFYSYNLPFISFPPFCLRLISHVVSPRRKNTPFPTPLRLQFLTLTATPYNPSLSSLLSPPLLSHAFSPSPLSRPSCPALPCISISPSHFLSLILSPRKIATTGDSPTERRITTLSCTTPSPATDQHSPARPQRPLLFRSLRISLCSSDPLGESHHLFWSS